MKTYLNYLNLCLVFLLINFLQCNLYAQGVSSIETVKTLAGYNYLELIENPDSSDAKPPLIIVLHWMGSSPESFKKYITGFEKKVRLLLVEAPYAFEKGFSYFSIAPMYYDLPPDEKMNALLDEGKKLSHFVKAAINLYKPETKPVIIGASQGGDLSYVIGIRYPELISLSCPLLATMDQRIIAPIRNSTDRVPIIAFHGTSDPVVSIETARSHIKQLKANGHKAGLKEYEGVKHELPPTMKKDYIDLINRTIFE